MKLSIATLAAVVATASAFAPSPAFKSSSTELMAKSESSRMEFIQQSVAAMSAFALFPSNANAAKYGSFGAGSPEVLDPKSAIVDDEIMASQPVQDAFAAVKTYKTAVENMKAALDKNNQADIGASVRKDLELVKLRADLNTLNTAFDEDTQRGTDRLVRLIFQDVTELETANRQKEGVTRSEKRLAIMYGKLNKLDKAFSDYLAFV